jgi:hypothetical protein
VARAQAVTNSIGTGGPITFPLPFPPTNWERVFLRKEAPANILNSRQQQGNTRHNVFNCGIPCHKKVEETLGSFEPQRSWDKHTRHLSPHLRFHIQCSTLPVGWMCVVTAQDRIAGRGWVTPKGHNPIRVGVAPLRSDRASRERGQSKYK